MTLPPTPRPDNRGRATSPWVPCGPAAPCVICGRSRQCARSADGRVAVCYHASCSARYGRGVGKRRARRRYWLYFLPPTAPPVQAPGEKPDISPVADDFRNWLTAPLAEALLAHLGLPAWATDVLTRLGVGWHPPRYVRRKRRRNKFYPEGWTFPERDGRGRVIGLQVRHRDGSKRQHPDTGRGLAVPDAWRERAIALGVVFLVEGASDVIAMLAGGLAAVGRPSNLAGVAHLVELLADLPAGVRIVVVGERDLKPANLASRWRWPGRAGAYWTAAKLARQLGRPVEWALAPAKSPGDPKDAAVKDVRDWLKARAARSRRTTRRQWAALGQELSRRILADTSTVTPTGPMEPPPGTERNCPRPHYARFKGKPHTSAAGRRAAADCRCGRFTCPLIPDPDRPGRHVRPCAVWRANRLKAWLWRCVLRYCDPAHVPEDPGELPMPDGPAVGADRGGPWDLYVGVVDDRQMRGVRNSLSRQAGRLRCRVHERVRIRLADLDPDADPRSQPGCWRLVHELVPGLTRAKRQHRVSLLVVATNPMVKPPRCLRRVSPADAVDLISAALSALPPPDPETAPDAGDNPGKATRRRFVDATPAWRPPDDLFRSGRWYREGRSAVPAAGVRTLSGACGIADPDHAMAAVQDSAVWKGDKVRSWLFGRMLEPDVCPRDPDPGEFAGRHEGWAQVIESLTDVVIGRRVDEEMGARLKRLPGPGDREALRAAAETDAGEARAMAEAREIDRGIREHYRDKPFPTTGFLAEIYATDERSRRLREARAARRQEWLRRWHRLHCPECDKGKEFYPRPKDGRVACLRCRAAGKESVAVVRPASRLTSYEPPKPLPADFWQTVGG